MHIGILDFGAFDMRNNYSWQAALESTIDLCNFADKIGIDRYWLGEHYGYGLSWFDPQVIVGLLAGNTDKITIGTGGLNISHHSPFTVLNNFKIFDALFGSRVEIGITASINKMEEQKAIQNIKNTDYYSNLLTILKYRNDPHSSQIGFANSNFPKIWLLGTGAFSFNLAQKYDLNYCFSLFHKNSKIDNILNLIHKKTVTINHSIAIAGTCCQNIKKSTFYDSANIISNHFEGYDEMKFEIQQLLVKYKTDNIMFLITSNNQEIKKETIENLAKLKNEL